MRTALAACFLVAAASAPAAAQAILPRTGPNWTFPNGFGQRWISPPARGSAAPRAFHGRGNFRWNGNVNPYWTGSYWHGTPYAPGGHISYYYGPGMSYRAGYGPYVYPNGAVIIWNGGPVSGTACWY